MRGGGGDGMMQSPHSVLEIVTMGSILAFVVCRDENDCEMKTSFVLGF